MIVSVPADANTKLMANRLNPVGSSIAKPRIGTKAVTIIDRITAKNDNTFFILFRLRG